MKRLLLALLLALTLSTATPAAVDFYQGATCTAVASGTGDTAAVAAAADLRLIGFSAKEDATPSAAAEFIIRNGTASTHPIICYVKLAAGESIRDYLGDAGVACPAGIYIDRVSGTTAITILSKQ